MEGGEDGDGDIDLLALAGEDDEVVKDQGEAVFAPAREV